MIRNHSGQKPPPMTLAIGDGANDVPMIMEAHVGVGISGNEGMQAVRSADYAIAQFRFLEPLTLVHGRDNYKRISVVVLYMLYKNAFLVTSLFLFGVFSGFTGTALYDSLMLAGFNPAWTVLPAILFGVIDRDVSYKAAMGVPQLYRDGQLNSDFNLRALFKWYALANLHACGCFFLISYTYMGKVVREGESDDGLYPFGTVVLQALVIAVNLKITLVSSILPTISVVAYVFGVALFLGLGALHSLWQFSSLGNPGQQAYEYFEAFPTFIGAAVPWLSQLLAIVALFIPDIVLEYCRRTFAPKTADIIREMDVGHNGGLEWYLRETGQLPKGGASV
jgi:magnesium-transporting ATPase (P-type)